MDENILGRIFSSETCYNEHGFCGALISGRPQTGNVFLDDPIYYPVWDVLTKHDVPAMSTPTIARPRFRWLFAHGNAEKLLRLTI